MSPNSPLRSVGPLSSLSLQWTDDDDKNVWGLPPCPKRIPQALFSCSMQKTLKEHFDVYVHAIEHEETDEFWEWFMDIWVRLYPETVTNHWAKEYQASRIETRLDLMGSQIAKNELAMYKFMCSIPESVSDDSVSSSTSEDSTDQFLSGDDDDDDASTLSSQVSCSTSLLAWADDGHDILLTDGKQGKKAKKVGLELKMRAKTRLLYWQVALPVRK
ncbi:uncharacterized protein EV420DRAFT_1635848 [Desarmillaria tabescens]|uniref:Uncharacterized protein n=1 Tax=Armillaria tabescens TaxID=1929756 RepID=A0AA39NJU5_ARMTA|nr:uncharacterized protein EV420DRAFT_1635848 [Desarmillaria tabescens]KAK0466808.1 hypothetical protein EV420DRAFT_1635848 [Desarmillaria tabescens]